MPQQIYWHKDKIDNNNNKKVTCQKYRPFKLQWNFFPVPPSHNNLLLPPAFPVPSCQLKSSQSLCDGHHLGIWDHVGHTYINGLMFSTLAGPEAMYRSSNPKCITPIHPTGWMFVELYSMLQHLSIYSVLFWLREFCLFLLKKLT